MPSSLTQHKTLGQRSASPKPGPCLLRLGPAACRSLPCMETVDLRRHTHVLHISAHGPMLHIVGSLDCNRNVSLTYCVSTECTAYCTATCSTCSLWCHLPWLFQIDCLKCIMLCGCLRGCRCDSEAAPPGSVHHAARHMNDMIKHLNK